MTNQPSRPKPPDATDSSVAWFCVLSQARSTDNYALALKANQHLKRLGVDVRFRRRPHVSSQAT